MMSPFACTYATSAAIVAMYSSSVEEGSKPEPKERMIASKPVAAHWSATKRIDAESARVA